MNKKQKERKERERKERAKARVIARRAHIRKTDKKVREDMKWQEHFRPKLLPIRNDQTVRGAKSEVEPAMTSQTPVDDPRRVEWVKHRLEHNMRILEALERELKAEEAERKHVQETLAEQGAVTLQEQMALLAEKAEKAVAGEEPKTEQDLVSLLNKQTAGNKKIRGKSTATFIPTSKSNSDAKAD